MRQALAPARRPGVAPQQMPVTPTATQVPVPTVQTRRSLPGWLWGSVGVVLTLLLVIVLGPVLFPAAPAPSSRPMLLSPTVMSAPAAELTKSPAATPTKSPEPIGAAEPTKAPVQPAAAPQPTKAPAVTPTKAPEPIKAPEPTKTAAATTTPAPTKASEPTKAPEPTKAAASGQANKFVTWYTYDERNADPKADERVGNEYLRKTIPLFNKAFESKWVWENRYTPFDKIQATIIAAVQAKGDIPDLVDIYTSDVINKYHKNGTMQDLSAWAKAQKWWSDMDPNAIKTCTAPDGKLICIPMSEGPAVVFVWKDRWPNGFPKTPEEFLKEVERLKKEGKYAMTFFGSTDFDGIGAYKGVWTTIASFGGTYDDGKGKMLLNTSENIAAIQFLRTLVQSKYVPEIAFAGQFQEEGAFKDGSAGSFPTDLLTYRYLNPLTAPSGRKYEKKNQDDMLDAVAAGDVFLAPMVSPAGKKPGCDVRGPALAIPVGAKNPGAAYDYINWLFTPEQNSDYVLITGVGRLPVLMSLQAGPQYQTPFYKQAVAAVSASECKPWFGSLMDNAAAQKAVMTVIYKLIRQDSTADIAAELTKAQDAFNKQQ